MSSTAASGSRSDNKSSSSAPFPLYKNAIQAMLQFLTLPQLHIAMQVNKLFLSAVATMKSVAPILTLRDIPVSHYKKSALAKRVNTIGLETITSVVVENSDKAVQWQELLNAFPCLTETYQFHMDRFNAAQLKSFVFPATLKIIDMSCASNVLDTLIENLSPQQVPLLHTLKLKVVVRKQSSEDVTGFRKLVGLTELHLLISDAYGYSARNLSDNNMHMLCAALVSEARRLPNLAIFNLNQGAPPLDILEIFAGRTPTAHSEYVSEPIIFPVPEDDGDVARLPKLQRIDLYGVTVSAEYLDALSWFGSTLTDINYAMGGLSCTDLFTPLSRMSALKRLHLKFDFENGKFRTPPRENYTNAVCSVKTLTSLQVQHNDLSDDDLQRILYACNNLRELIVQDCPALLQLAYFKPTETDESDYSKADRSDHSCAGSLRSLSLYRCSNLAASEAHHLRGLTSLRKLDIRDSFAEVLSEEEKSYFDPNSDKCPLSKLEQFFYQFRGPLRRMERKGKPADSL